VQLLAAERTGDREVVARLVAAAERALGRGAVEEAVVPLRRALEEPPPPEARYQVLIRLADAERLAASGEAAIGHARAAIELADDPDEQEAAALLLATLLGIANRAGEGIEVLGATASALRGSAPEHALRLDVERLSFSVLLPRPPPDIGPQMAALVTEVTPGSLAEHKLRAQLALLDATLGTRPA
jgi:hypothetical protein